MGFFEGKTIIITGGGKAPALKDGSAGSIGYGIAIAFAKEGANLVLTGRNEQKLLDAKAELEAQYGIKVLAIPADISAGADNEATVKRVYYDKENVEHKIVRKGLKLDIANGIVTIDKVDFKSDASKFDVNTEIEFKVTLTTETEKYYEDIKDKYVRVWLNPNVTTVTVTKDFAPTLRVKKH